jgi:hypothetical protein
MKINTNDLIGLKYGWGYAPGDGTGMTDCFQLVCEMRDRMGLSDYREQFEWVYDKYTEDTFCRRLIPRWLLQYGTRLDNPKVGAVLLLPSHAGGALGTVVTDGALFLASSGNVVRSQWPMGIGYYFWMN